jgi:hypothetical protein
MSKAKKPAAKKKPKSVKMFLVVRDAFDANPYDGLHFDRPTDDNGERVSVVPVRAFATRKAANEYARQLDAEVRVEFPPPLFTMDDGNGEEDHPPLAPAVTAKLKELGLPAIKFGKDAYKHGEQFRAWWAEWAWDMTAEQKAALWEPFAGMTFHGVTQIDVEG